MLSDISDIYANFVKIKKPDSSPASDIRERNYRDCDAKLVIICHITKAVKQISGRQEQITPSKIIAELTLGFWVSLLNSEYERILWKDLRRAFPFMPKAKRQRKYVSAPLNRFRTFRNRIFHNESICWNINHIKGLHSEMVEVLRWMNRDVPVWLSKYDRFNTVSDDICYALSWK